MLGFHGACKVAVKWQPPALLFSSVIWQMSFSAVEEIAFCLPLPQERLVQYHGRFSASLSLQRRMSCFFRRYPHIQDIHTPLRDKVEVERRPARMRQQLRAHESRENACAVAAARRKNEDGEESLAPAPCATAFALRRRPPRCRRPPRPVIVWRRGGARCSARIERRARCRDSTGRWQRTIRRVCRYNDQVLPGKRDRRYTAPSAQRSHLCYRGQHGLRPPLYHVAGPSTLSPTHTSDAGGAGYMMTMINALCFTVRERPGAHVEKSCYAAPALFANEGAILGGEREKVARNSRRERYGSGAVASTPAFRSETIQTYACAAHVLSLRAYMR